MVNGSTLNEPNYNCNDLSFFQAIPNPQTKMVLAILQIKPALADRVNLQNLSFADMRIGFLGKTLFHLAAECPDGNILLQLLTHLLEPTSLF